MTNIKKFAKIIINLFGYDLAPFNQLEKSKEVRYSQIYTKYSNYTMISKDVFTANLDLCLNFQHLQGVVVECGVWRGGMIAAMSEVLGDRKYFLFDSFEGLPTAKEIDGESAIAWQKDTGGDFYFDNCKAEIYYAEQAMSLSPIKDYQLVKGWFSETLPNFDFNEQIAILRLDADWYESTIQCLDYLYPKVIEGGLIILDDYYTWDGCSRAVHDYLSSNKLTARIRSLKGGNCYIVKN
jgi:O-methyltransferase